MAWYTEIWPNPRLDSLEKICTKIPRLRSTSDKQLMLNYYTSILKKCEDNGINSYAKGNIRADLVKELSMRISENCGRTAQPSMTREFNLDNVEHVIQLYEPSLTADNLGWKTWGASLILSQKVVNLLEKNKDQKHIHPLRVLELGSGTGLVGIAWASKWRQSFGTENIEMFVTDLPDIVANLKKNVQTNDLTTFVEADILDWTNPDDFIEKHGDEKFDVILVADPIYSPNHPEWVVNMLCRFLKDNGVCHFEIPLRDKYARERELLSQLLERNNFSVISEDFTDGLDDWGAVKYVYKEIVKM